MRWENRQNRPCHDGGHVRHGRPCAHQRRVAHQLLSQSVYASLKNRSIRQEATAGAGCQPSTLRPEATGPLPCTEPPSDKMIPYSFSFFSQELPCDPSSSWCCSPDGRSPISSPWSELNLRSVSNVTVRPALIKDPIFLPTPSAPLAAPCPVRSPPSARRRRPIF